MLLWLKWEVGLWSSSKSPRSNSNIKFLVLEFNEIYTHKDKCGICER